MSFDIEGGQAPSVLKARWALRGAPLARAFSAHARVCTTTSDALCPALHLSGRPEGGEQKAKFTVPSSKDPGFTGPERLSSTKAPSARLREASRGAFCLPRRAHMEPLRIWLYDTRVFSTGVKRALCAARRFLQPWQSTSTAVDRPNPESRVGSDGSPCPVELALFRLCLPSG